MDEQKEISAAQRRTQATITEAFVFKLANRMGGRKEVLDLPADEAFKFMEMALEEDEAKVRREAEKFFLDTLSRLYTAPPQQGEKQEFGNARRRFFEMIKPDKQLPAANGNKEPKKFEWNIPPEALEMPVDQEGG